MPAPGSPPAGPTAPPEEAIAPERLAPAGLAPAHDHAVGPGAGRAGRPRPRRRWLGALERAGGPAPLRAGRDHRLRRPADRERARPDDAAPAGVPARDAGRARLRGRPGRGG